MSKLFNPVKIGEMEIKNRFVRSATADCLADDNGQITDDYLKHFERLAKGDVGLIITGNYYVNAIGRHISRTPVLDDDSIIDGLRKVVKTVHPYGARIVAQSNHAGRQTDKRVVANPVAPSAVKDATAGIKPREMSPEEIEGTIEDFAEASRRVKEAGFDGVQIHSAHGYLINQFLSAHTNRRTDQWGGSPENRRRFLIKVYKAIREKVGPDYPVLVKLSADETVKNGLTLEDAEEICQQLETLGLDAVEVSGGISDKGLSIMRGDIPNDIVRRDRNMIERLVILLMINTMKKNSAFEEEYYLPQAAAIKKCVSIPIISVGGMRQAARMERVVEQRQADMVSMARPFVRQPNLVKLFAENKTDSASYVNCNRCSLEVVMHFNPLRCYNAESPKS
jgi:2,4-dienoyl-CoA reductase-like NADH-dependent reductase (Old Yellow Enzyme family)